MRLLPSKTMGEYTAGLSRPDDGGLYPLEEPGTYGRVPKKEHQGKWAGPQPYVKRERKPKMYASYAISDKCELHALVLDKYDRRSKKDDQKPGRFYMKSLRAVSVPPETDPIGEEKTAPVEHCTSLPPDFKKVDVEDLQLISKLNLGREVKEDTFESLRSVLGEEEITREC